ncbi:hypothetical protein V2G26_019721 [Clonostachys chloroleuca]
MKAENIELVNSEKVENYAERKRVEEKEIAKRPADYDGRGRFLMADVKGRGEFNDGNQFSSVCYMLFTQPVVCMETRGPKVCVVTQDAPSLNAVRCDGLCAVLRRTREKYK